MRKLKYLIDDRTYTVTAPNGYRCANMTLEQAQLHATRLRDQMRIAGWAGEVRIYYRDGTEVRAGT